MRGNACSTEFMRKFAALVDQQLNTRELCALYCMKEREVKRLKAALKTERLVRGGINTTPQHLQPTHYMQIATIPEEQQVEVAREADEARWTVARLQEEVRRRRNGHSTPCPGEACRTSVGTLHFGDFREQLKGLADNSVDLVFTDPPYGGEYLSDWEDLAVLAQRILKKGAYLIAYSGQNFLPQVMGSLGRHLDYYWLLAVPFEARMNHTRLWGKNLWNAWKPMLVYSKGRPGPHQWCPDVVRIPASEKTEAKLWHDWGQPVGEATQVLQAFAPPGGTVVDPFAGSGTTLIAASLLGLPYVGAEISAEAYAQAAARLKKVATP